MRKMLLTSLVSAALFAACDNKAGPGRLVATDPAPTTTSTSTTTIAPPTIAAFVFSPAAPKVDQKVTFNAVSSSVAPDRAITDYSWNFGDGGTARGVTASTAYALEGVYNVTLTVTDNTGTKATATLPVPVAGMLPTTTTTVIPTSASARYVNNQTLPTSPNDMSLFFQKGPGADFTVTGIFSTVNNVVTGVVVEGTFAGTITPSITGTFTGKLKVDDPPCTRTYSGTVDQLLQWTGEMPAPACAGAGTALAFDSFILLKSAAPPGAR